jgi:hypothetical protein
MLETFLRSRRLLHLKMAELGNTMVSIRFSGKDLDPKKLGALLGFIESESTEMTVKRLKSGRVVWSIRLQNKEFLPLEKKIEALLGEFTKEINTWKRATEYIKADIFCGLFLDEWNKGFSLTPPLTKELSDRNLEIGFDVYSPTDTGGK